MKALMKTILFLAVLLAGSWLEAAEGDGYEQDLGDCTYIRGRPFLSPIAFTEARFTAPVVAARGHGGLGLGVTFPHELLPEMEPQACAERQPSGKWVGRIRSGRSYWAEYEVWIALPQLNWTSPGNGQTADINDEGRTFPHTHAHEVSHLLVDHYLNFKISEHYVSKVALIQTQPKDTQAEAGT